MKIKDKFFSELNILKRLASNSQLLQKHSSCLIKRGKILGFGVNKYFGVKINGGVVHLTVHAEVDALASVNTNLIKGSDIIIIRVGNSGQLKNSRPCNACIEKLRLKGIKKVYYSNDDGEISCEFVQEMPLLHSSSGTRFRQRH